MMIILEVFSSSVQKKMIYESHQPRWPINFVLSPAIMDVANLDLPSRF